MNQEERRKFEALCAETTRSIMMLERWTRYTVPYAERRRLIERQIQAFAVTLRGSKA